MLALSTCLPPEAESSVMAEKTISAQHFCKHTLRKAYITVIRFITFRGKCRAG